MMKFSLILLIVALCLQGCGLRFQGTEISGTVQSGAALRGKALQPGADSPDLKGEAAGQGQLAKLRPQITAKPVLWDDKRQQLMKKYAREHYGSEFTTITPQVVVVHWTAAATLASTYNYFYSTERAAPYQGTLNVGSQFLVDRDGTINQLMPDNALARHAIGYNWCAIGIENVGGVNNREDLTDLQLKANVQLITYLKAKYPTIKYVWGHYQQDAARKSGLYKELESGYYSPKVDPGPVFMAGLKKGLEGQNLIFY